MNSMHFTTIEAPGLRLYRVHGAWLTAFLIGMAFLAFPLPLHEKAHAVMHGLCAQRPSHSLKVGATLLPVDARMTGIYLGLLTGLVVLTAAGWHRRAGLPSKGAAAVLVAMVAAMAVDGFNSLAFDLQMPTLYTPENRLRVFTGLGVGIALASILAMLLGMSLWARPRVSSRMFDRWWQPGALYAAALPVALLAMTEWKYLAVPLTLLLVVSAVMTFSALALAIIVMTTGRENTCTKVSDLRPMLVWAMIGGVVVMGLLAGMRYGLEVMTGAPALT
jgi:uncharacterized membrane protein